MLSREFLTRFGPGSMVAAAFIGPGAVTTASVAGADFGYSLIWVIVFSILVTMILQEMSARLGLVSGAGLGEALRTEFSNPGAKYASVALVISAIWIGTAAFETGNIVGGAAGLTTLTGVSETVWGPAIGLLAGALLWTGKYKLIERALVGMIGVMAFAFVVTAVLVGPDLAALAGGFVPSVPDGSIVLIAGLVGTTINGYNLFLHASSVNERWSGPEDLDECRTDTVVSIAIGGLILVAIAITAATIGVGSIENVGQMAEQLRPLVGGHATLLFGIGLFAAGFTSSITAPLAGAYATAGILGWEVDLTSTKFRLVWGSILLVGFVFSGLGMNPVEVIVFAQATNGILLPILAVFLLYVMNSQANLDEFTNSPAQNVLGAVVTLVVAVIGIRTLLSVAGLV